MRTGERILLALCLTSIGAIAYAAWMLYDVFTDGLR